MVWGLDQIGRSKRNQDTNGIAHGLHELLPIFPHPEHMDVSL